MVIYLQHSENGTIYKYLYTLSLLRENYFLMTITYRISRHLIAVHKQHFKPTNPPSTLNISSNSIHMHFAIISTYITCISIIILKTNKGKFSL